MRQAVLKCRRDECWAEIQFVEYKIDLEPGLPGWATHPSEGPKWGRKWVKFEGKLENLIEIWGKNEESGNLAPGILPTRDCEAGYGLAFNRLCTMSFTRSHYRDKRDQKKCMCVFGRGERIAQTLIIDNGSESSVPMRLCTASACTCPAKRWNLEMLCHN